MLIVPIIGGCAGSSEPTGRSDLEWQFQDEFGFTPPSIVSNIHCKVVHVGDTRGKWLSFSFEMMTFQRITNQGFSAAAADLLRNPGQSLWCQDIVGHNPNEPRWWRKPSTDGKDPVYYRERNATNFNQSYIFLWVNPSNQTVYVRTAAWD